MRSGASSSRGRCQRLRTIAGTITRPLLFEALEHRCLLSADTPSAATDRLDFEPHHVLVRFADDFDFAALDGLLPGSRLDSSLDLVSGLYRVAIPVATTVADAIGVFENNPSVVYAQPDYRVQLNYFSNDTALVDGGLWGLQNFGQDGGAADADIDAPEAWDISLGSPHLVVAVIDSGIDYRHPDLAANIWTNPGEIAGDNLDNDGNGYVDDIHGFDFANEDSDPMDDDGHGTHVAGTIAAVADNGIGIVGVSPQVQIMALKFLDDTGSGFISDAVAALNYAVAMGAQISNNSWGSWINDRALGDAIRSAGERGHLFVTAAGNENSNNDDRPRYPANYTFDNVITVAATDRNDRIASFSNWGATSVDVAAPGVGILSTLPGGRYGTLSGTSMATPHVTGGAALVMASDPRLSIAEVKQRLLRGADPIGQIAGNAAKPTLTNGRLNVHRALVPDLELSGAVTVAVENGSLIVEGTANADNIAITGIVAGSGTYRIVTASGEQILAGVLGDIVVRLHGGDDVLTLNNAYAAENIVLDAGDGNDTLVLGNESTVSSGLDLNVDLGSGNDQIDGKRLYIGRNQIIQAGAGNDQLTFDGLLSPEFTLGTSAAGAVQWGAGDGDDRLSVVYGFIVGAVSIDLGSGNDAALIFGSAISANVALRGGNGTDSLTVDANFFDADLFLDGGDDGDVIIWRNGLGTEVGTIAGANGDDTIWIGNQTCRQLSIDAGGGRDQADVRASAFDRFFAQMGDGDDRLTIYGNVSRLQADFDGGLGLLDELLDLGNGFNGTVNRRGFERF
jgi:subtilisin family serine protease